MQSIGVTAEFRRGLYGLDMIIANVTALIPRLWELNICCLSNRRPLVPLFR